MRCLSGVNKMQQSSDMFSGCVAGVVLLIIVGLVALALGGIAINGF